MVVSTQGGSCLAAAGAGLANNVSPAGATGALHNVPKLLVAISVEVKLLLPKQQTRFAAYAKPVGKSEIGAGDRIKIWSCWYRAQAWLSKGRRNSLGVLV